MSEQQTNVDYGEKKEDLKDFKGDAGLALRWLKEINLVKNSKAQRAFENNGEKIVKKYKNTNLLTTFTTESLPSARVMFNVLWSNVQVLKPCLFARIPKVVVERRFKDQDPVGRLAASIAERCTTYMVQTQQDRFKHAISSAVEDRLLPGRGQVWLRYDAEFEEQKDEQGEPILEGDQVKKTIKPNSEMVWVDYVYWQDYLESSARNPFETRWRARRHWMTRSKLIKEFGATIGKAVELQSDGRKKKLTEEDEFLLEAEVWQIADSESKRMIWVCEGYKDGPLKITEDVLRIKDFFPCPVPLLATTSTDSTYPTPDYLIYERLADELDYVTKRLSAMVEMVRVVGMHAAALGPKLKQMLGKRDGETVAVENWAQFMGEKGGIKGAIDWFQFDQVVAAIPILTQYQQQLLGQIFEITGIPDIVRGHTNPNETAHAQQMKGAWTTVKLQENQGDVQRFCREIYGKEAEIIFEPGLFTDDTICLMDGMYQRGPDEQQMWPEALELLRNDRLRTFRVDIETDSTIAIDEDMESERWRNYMQAVQGMVSEIQGISQFRPELIFPIVESAKAAMRSFRTGRSVEAAWDKAWDQIEDSMKPENQPPPGPDYEMMKVQSEQAKIQVAQLEAQIKQQAEQFNQWFKPQELQAKTMADQMKFELESQKLQIEAMGMQNKAQVDSMARELEVFKTNFDQFVKTQELELEKYRVVLDEKEKFLEEARLASDMRLEQREKEAEAVVGKGKASQPVNIHINGEKAELKQRKLKRKLMSVKRTPEGLIGESIELPDEDEVAA